jgi:hypothetical protein
MVLSTLEGRISSRQDGDSCLLCTVACAIKPRPGMFPSNGEAARKQGWVCVRPVILSDHETVSVGSSFLKKILHTYSSPRPDGAYFRIPPCTNRGRQCGLTEGRTTPSPAKGFQHG